jgi:hypothetical protein
MGHPVSFEKLTIVIYPPTANTFIGVLVRGFDRLIGACGYFGYGGAINVAAVDSELDSVVTGPHNTATTNMFRLKLTIHRFEWKPQTLTVDVYTVSLRKECVINERKDGKR